MFFHHGKCIIITVKADIFTRSPSFATPTHSTRYSRYISLVIPKANTCFGRLSFQFSAANDWNELQKSLKMETYFSLINFKRQLSEQLTDRCSCTQPICK